MMNIPQIIHHTVRSQRAQILLPAVMLAPIFILVVYLLFETSKLSMTKVRQQFALDNAAYAQMSVTSGYLNSLAMVNGPLPYRVMKTMSQEIPAKQSAEDQTPVTVFDVFYRAGAFPAAGPSHELGVDGAVINPSPAPESTDWGFEYYAGARAGWAKEDPDDSPEEEGKYVMTSEYLADNYFFGASGIGLASIKEYATIFIRTGSIYSSHNYVYHDNFKKARMFREAYFLNTRDCNKKDCGKQGADTLERYELETTPFEINNTRFYVSADFQGSTAHSGAYPIDLVMEEIVKAKLFQFAYLPGASRSQLRKLKRGITLKQKFMAPANRFNIDITSRYKPYVKNSVSISCPRSNNNCVWPNPLPKYSVQVGL